MVMDEWFSSVYNYTCVEMLLFTSQLVDGRHIGVGLSLLSLCLILCLICDLFHTFMITMHGTSIWISMFPPIQEDYRNTKGHVGNSKRG